MSNAIWIVWDDHRRSRELANYLGVEYIVCEYSGAALLRYIVLTFRTLDYVFKKKPNIIFCQNPSVVLASLLAVFARRKKFTLIVDRHSNFKIEPRGTSLWKWRLFHLFSDYSLRAADLTIVTNSEAADYVSSIGGVPAVLPDKLPGDVSAVERMLQGEVKFLFICSFDLDEPVDSVLNSFRCLGSKYHVYVTGNFMKYHNWKEYYNIENIHFLGFVDETEYLSYLNSVDATIVLSDMPMTLNCGSYESVKAGKPQIVSDSLVIREWFRRGAVYVDPKVESSILRGIKEIVERLDELKMEQKHFSETLDSEWKVLEKKTRQRVYEISGHEI